MYYDRTLAVPSAVLQNPHNPTPLELAKDMVMIEVRHYNFLGLILTGKIIVHKLIAADVQKFFALAFKIRFPIHSVTPVSVYNWDDQKSCLANNSSGHNMRDFEIEGKTKLSKHAIGCAFDINPRQNPCFVLDEKTLATKEVIPFDGTYIKTNAGTLYSSHPLVELMTSLGWAWGGNWNYPKDYQHFQIVPFELAQYV